MKKQTVIYISAVFLQKKEKEEWPCNKMCTEDIWE